jgi:Uma2 family endonuclease
MSLSPSSSPYAVLQAKLQAWLVTMLTVVVEAYELGAVIGKGARIASNGEVLTPDVLYVPNSDRKRVKPDAIQGAAPLAIDVLHSRVPADERANLRQRYAAAGVLEYWQVDADKGQAHFYQADADGRYDDIPPDANGMHFSCAIVHLAFPVDWFRKQPDLLTVMQWWGLIESDEAEEDE